MKLWAGRFQKDIDQKPTISIPPSPSTAAWPGRISRGAWPTPPCSKNRGSSLLRMGEKIREGLAGIAADLAAGRLAIDPNAEDIHTFVEGELTARIGDAGKRLHTGRSRNDQVAPRSAPDPSKTRYPACKTSFGS